MRLFRDRREIGDAAEDVGILDDDAARLLVDRREQSFDVRFGRKLRQRLVEHVPGELGHRIGDGDIMGMEAAREHGLAPARSEEHTSELQSLMRISYAVFCLHNKTQYTTSLHISTSNI